MIFCLFIPVLTQKHEGNMATGLGWNWKRCRAIAERTLRFAVARKATRILKLLRPFKRNKV